MNTRYPDTPAGDLRHCVDCMDVPELIKARLRECADAWDREAQRIVELEQKLDDATFMENQAREHIDALRRDSEIRIAELEQQLKHAAVDADALDQAHKRIAELAEENATFLRGFFAND